MTTAFKGKQCLPLFWRNIISQSLDYLQYVSIAKLHIMIFILQVFRIELEVIKTEVSELNKKA